VQVQALSSRLFFRSQPLGTIWIDSPLRPAVVLENLRVRGKEWRESAVPEDLRKLKIGSLSVEIEGSQFQMRWLGDTNPFYNPLCFGTAQPYGDGSRIRAGFKLTTKDFLIVGCVAAMPVLGLLGRQSIFNWVLVGIMVMLLIYTAARNRSAEPMRTRLIEVLTNAAKGPVKNGSAADVTIQPA
jgi:hypothetical protein